MIQKIEKMFFDNKKWVSPGGDTGHIKWFFCQ